MSDAADRPASPEPSDASSPVRLREVLSRMPDYKPGKPASAPAGITAYKLSSNENPYGPLPSVLAAIGDAATTVNRYPDMAVTALTQRLAAALDVPAECLATGTGSVAVLAQVVNAACDAGDEVVFAWRSFEAYPIVAQLAGAEPVMVGLDADARHRLDAMAAAITDHTRVVLVCTPNNPTGPCVHEKELEAFLDKVPSDVIVVVGTFSKAYGLAGLRVGYAVAHPPVAAAIRKTATPFGVNSLAQVAAIASLDAFDELAERVATIVAERDRVVLALGDQGWKLPRSDANFVWFPLGSDSAAFSEACQEAGLMVRQYGDDGVRVTIGEADG